MEHNIGDHCLDFIGGEISIPYNKEGNHWLLFRILRSDHAIRVYDSMKQEKLEKELDLLVQLNIF